MKELELEKKKKKEEKIGTIHRPVEATRLHFHHVSFSKKLAIMLKLGDNQSSV